MDGPEAPSHVQPTSGQPTLSRSSSAVDRHGQAGWVALAAVIILPLAAGVIFVLPGLFDGPNDGTTRDPSQLPETTTLVPDSPASIATDPQTTLMQQAASDQEKTEQLVDYWVPQISSKSVGMTVGGTTFGYREILQDFETMRAAAPDSVLLLQSESYSTFSQPGFWVTVVARGYANGEAANSWCVYNGFDQENCFAKLLSHSYGPEGATLHW